MKTSKKFQEVIKNTRVKAELSQRGMATKLKICQATISKLEDGSLNPTIHVLKNMRKEFKFNVNKFLDAN